MKEMKKGKVRYARWGLTLKFIEESQKFITIIWKRIKSIRFRDIQEGNIILALKLRPTQDALKYLTLQVIPKSSSSATLMS